MSEDTTPTTHHWDVLDAITRRLAPAVIELIGDRVAARGLRGLAPVRSSAVSQRARGLLEAAKSRARGATYTTWERSALTAAIGATDAPSYARVYFAIALDRAETAAKSKITLEIPFEVSRADLARALLAEVTCLRREYP